MSLLRNSKHVSKIFPIESSDEVLKEVLHVLRLISSDFNTAPVRHVFNAAARLYSGTFQGYRACNTRYHDFGHAIATFLAMSRLIHGAVLSQESFSERQIITALIAALLHDAGYIQEESDTLGTGAKYKATHEQRSMEFLSRHGFEFGLSDDEIAAGRAIVLCTDMDTEIDAILFPAPRIKLLGKMLAAADLMAQLADRLYLEKLLYFYCECQEAGVGDYENEVDLFYKAVHFYVVFDKRLKTTLGGVDRFMPLHFASRWDINKNPYHEAINAQKNYLEKILEIPNADPRKYLRRNPPGTSIKI